MVYRYTVESKDDIFSLIGFESSIEFRSVRPGERLPEPTVQATFNMVPELHERLKAQAAAEGRSMREIMEDALKNYFVRSENESQELGK